ncbi:MAG: ribosome maturation factor RimM, partial [Mycobacteriaceae bacterium]
LLSIRPAGAEQGEQLVPFVSAIVLAVDVDARTIVIDPPDGLLES